MQNLQVTPRIVFLRAAEIMRERGWGRCTYESTDRRVCLMGAVMRALESFGLPGCGREQPMFRECDRILQKLIGFESMMVIWNDHHCGSADEALALLDAAAAA